MAELAKKLYPQQLDTTFLSLRSARSTSLSYKSAREISGLAPYASNICHAKDGIAENGKFYPDDFPASMKVMGDAGFHGVYSLEFEDLGDPIDGVRRLKESTEENLN